MTNAELNADGISNQKIPQDLKKRLVRLAQKYETSDFLKSDPSQFLYYYNDPKDIELCAFTASLLSFGSRKQFIPKIQFVMQQADLSGGIFYWIKNRDFEKTFSADNNKKFYRFYSYRDFYILFSLLSQILQTDETFGIFLNSRYNDFLNNQTNRANLIPGTADSTNLADIISECFANCKIVPSTKTSAKKRLCMFLRWMVRDGSPVDIGLWRWYPKTDLLIPLDVHVLQEAQKLNIISEKESATRKTAQKLTDFAKQIFPDDPAKLDFALFGIGVDSLQDRSK
ncbi:MAG: TIGR02757 family protein [Treponema sp.]